MKLPGFFIFSILFLTLLNVYGIVWQVDWAVPASGIGMLVPLILYFSKKLEVSNHNLVAFCCFIFIAVLASGIENLWFYKILGLVCLMSAYIFLVREALIYIQRESASNFMLIYFVLVFLINCYLIFMHLQELEHFMSNRAEFAMYILYYINLLLMGFVALIFYLNSYSRKSVYFITLVLAFIFADIFRDMGEFYLQDTAIVVVGNLLRFAALIFAFLFFITPEKKLRLLHMI